MDSIIALSIKIHPSQVDTDLCRAQSSVWSIGYILTPFWVPQVGTLGQ